jgi:hypothetical protein
VPGKQLNSNKPSEITEKVGERRGAKEKESGLRGRG